MKCSPQGKALVRFRSQDDTSFSVPFVSLAVGNSKRIKKKRTHLAAEHSAQLDSVAVRQRTFALGKRSIAVVATTGKLGHTRPQSGARWTEQCTIPHADSEEPHAPDVQYETDAAAIGHSSVDWAELVERIHRGEDSGMEDLYRLFAKGVRFYLCRQLGGQEI